MQRPIRCADLRISGMDESVTAKKLIAAVAKAGECPPEQVKTNGPHLAANGAFTAMVSCPVATAKKLNDGRHLLVGWVSAKIKLLQPRLRRCFRCLQGGHAGAKCLAEVVYSQLCFCGSQPGHKAKGCSVDPHCAFCIHAARPSGHRMGGRACVSPTPNTERKRRGQRGKAPPQSQTLSAAGEAPKMARVVDMECQQ